MRPLFWSNGPRDAEQLEEQAFRVRAAHAVGDLLTYSNACELGDDTSRGIQPLCLAASWQPVKRMAVWAVQGN